MARLSDEFEQVSPNAILPQPPPTLPLWAKVLYYVVDTIATGVLINQYDNAAEIRPLPATTADPDAGTWRRFVVHFADTLSADTADDQQFSLDILNITGGQPDATWTSADYDTCEAHIDVIVGTLLQHVAARYTYDKLSAYVMAFNPYSNTKPFAQSGAPEWTRSKNVVGISAGQAGPQQCTTVTEETPSRKNWGRLYSPALGTGSIALTGRLGSASVDGIVSALGGSYEALMTAQLFPVVPTTMSDKQPKRTLQTVTGIRVDDVIDSHRSRRHKHSTHTARHPLAAEIRPSEEAAA